MEFTYVRELARRRAAIASKSSVVTCVQPPEAACAPETDGFRDKGDRAIAARGC